MRSEQVVVYGVLGVAVAFALVPKARGVGARGSVAGRGEAFA